MVKYVMDCAIGMQLHSHGLVKAYVTDGARVIHSHGLVKHVIEIRYHNLKTVMLNHKNDVKLFKITLRWGVLFQLSVDSLRSRVSSFRPPYIKLINLELAISKLLQIKSRVIFLRTMVSSHRPRVRTLRSRVGSLRPRVGTLRPRVSSLKTTVSSLT